MGEVMSSILNPLTWFAKDVKSHVVSDGGVHHDPIEERGENALGPEAIAFLVKHPEVIQFVAKHPEALEFFMKHPHLIKHALDHPEALKFLMEHPDAVNWIIPTGASLSAFAGLDDASHERDDLVDENKLSKRSSVEKPEGQDAILPFVPPVAQFQGLGSNIQLTPKSLDPGAVDGKLDRSADGNLGLVFIAIVVLVAFFGGIQFNKRRGDRKRKQQLVLPIVENSEGKIII